MKDDKKPGKLLAVLAVLTGIFLILSGIAAVCGYLGLPYLMSEEEILTSQLGQMAAIFLGLIGGGLALTHGIGSLRGVKSPPLQLPPPYFFWILFAVILGLGSLLSNYEVSTQYLFPLIFALGAALPTISVLAFAYRRLGFPVTWRQGSLAFVSGSTVSILVTLVLGYMVIPFFFYLLIEPLGYLMSDFFDGLGVGNFGFLERLFASPWLIFFLVITALEAPIPEEFAKALGPAMFGRRIRTERQAFAIGLASGAGFAILENMLYEGIYAEWSGWTWGGITLLRGFGSVLHPICTAIITLGLFRARDRQPGWFRNLGLAYLLAVGLHTLWNGGFESFLFLTGIDYYAVEAASVSIYGLYVEVLLIAFLLVLSAGLWWMLWRYTRRLGEGIKAEPVSRLVSPRAVAAWAFACALVIIPIGAALGPAWGQIKAVFLIP